ncbi:DSBA oxidoreductase [Pedobacter quisquiliarum]|uniref:DSBA oxidoreductase n=1 Tax=Pedobacter quisquiliarum TaxID=1834438 RepID=A0A916UGB1_9SPHI|nr:DsbA family oxidoreductase [Pedobacter quisquiliarum]GGC71931.1 DSBA oxidoreductase [Pedobacter quisquiliarum]
MEVKIWSDVRCPFCYIGKRKFETALAAFAHKDEVKITWKSFELDPNLQTVADTNIYEYFSKAKGIPQEQAVDMFNNVTQVAAEVGLDFKLDQSVVANSFKAHRVIQLAKTLNLGDEIEEALFKIHFMEGKNIDDEQVLTETAKNIGISASAVQSLFNGDDFDAEVRIDQLEAQRIGIRGVPFFVFDDKYAVSGAQAPEIFLQTLEKAYESIT